MHFVILKCSFYDKSSEDNTGNTHFQFLVDFDFMFATQTKLHLQMFNRF